MPHIICLAKQVPDPETPASQFRLPAPGIQPVPSQFDTIGVEAALRIKDKQPDTVITVLSLGPDSFRDTIKHCLAMGADEGVHINDPAVNAADHWATAEVLAAAIKKLEPFDLIIAGRQAVDWDMGIVGSTIAEILGIPVVTIAKDIQHNDGRVTVERVLLDGFEIGNSGWVAFTPAPSENSAKVIKRRRKTEHEKISIVSATRPRVQCRDSSFGGRCDQLQGPPSRSERSSSCCN